MLGSGYPYEPDIFNQPREKLKKLALDEDTKVQAGLLTAIQVVHHWREVELFGPKNVRYGITYKRRPTQRWSNTIIHATSVDIGVIIQSFFFTITAITLDSVTFNLEQVTFLCLFQSR